MRRILIIAITLALMPFIAVEPARAVEQIAGASARFKVAEIVQPKADTRAFKLRTYLESHQSPLAPYAPLFIKKADEYQLPDWKLVPAIAGVESTFGKAIPTDSYNAYGWANGNFAFKNWEESIDIVTKTLKTNYLDKGADTIEKIARIYAPPSQTWAQHVHFFMNKIDLFKPLDTRLALSL